MVIPKNTEDLRGEDDNQRGRDKMRNCYNNTERKIAIYGTCHKRTEISNTANY